MNKNIFLDCGSNLGQGFEHFRRVYGDEYEYHLYEPNPNCFKILSEKYGNSSNVFLNESAVYSKECELELYFKEPYSNGGSIIQDHNSQEYSYKDVDAVLTKCVDLGKIINDFDENTNIVLKLDVESSEYDILESLIKRKIIFKLNKIYCEFHSIYMNQNLKNEYEVREKNILNFVKENNIDLELWE
tara:strand:+ start:243 stop:803 length:561 start_codon:yes stop_codon:yes gene_type:complete